MYVYTCIRIYVCIHALYTYVYKGQQNLCRAQRRWCQRSYMCMHICTYISMCVCMHVYIYMYVHMCKCIYVYIYALYMYIYTGQQNWCRAQRRWDQRQTWRLRPRQSKWKLPIRILLQSTRWGSHTAHMNELCHKSSWRGEGVISHIWMSYVTNHVDEMRESYHTYEWAMSQIMSTRWGSHATCIIESLLQSNWRGERRVTCLKSTRWGSHVTCISESCHTSLYNFSRRGKGVIPHMWMSYVTNHVDEVRESCDMYEWVMSHITILLQSTR